MPRHFGSSGRIGSEAGFKKFQQEIATRDDVELAVDLKGWFQVVKNCNSAAPAICKQCKAPVRSSLMNFRAGRKRCDCSKVSNQFITGWKGPAGFERLQQLLAVGHVKDVRLMVDVDGWTKAVRTNRCKVPLECTICDAPVNSTIMNFLHHKSKGCCCSWKTETKLYRWLIDNFPSYTIVTQAAFASCEAVNRLRFDFGIDEFKIVIELDGIQHFEETKHYTASRPLARRQELDLVKECWAKRNGYTLIRLPQWNVWEDTNNWNEFIRVEIERAIAEPAGKVVFPDWAGVYKEGGYARLRSGTHQ